MSECVSFILVAAGKGTRFGGVQPKQYNTLAGRPLWRWPAETADVLFSKGLVDELILVVAPEDQQRVSGELFDLKVPVTLAAGGRERAASVMNGLMAARASLSLSMMRHVPWCLKGFAGN